MGCIGVRQFMGDVAMTFIGKKWELYFIFIREVIDFLLLCGVDLYRLALYVV